MVSNLRFLKSCYHIIIAWGWAMFFLLNFSKSRNCFLTLRCLMEFGHLWFRIRDHITDIIFWSRSLFAYIRTLLDKPTHFDLLVTFHLKMFCFPNDILYVVLVARQSFLFFIVHYLFAHSILMDSLSFRQEIPLASPHR